ncbi:MAG: prenyltransferase/squalene oxidase repeat-containing protein [Planctomycetota bacterium]
MSQVRRSRFVRMQRQLLCAAVHVCFFAPIAVGQAPPATPAPATPPASPTAERETPTDDSVATFQQPWQPVADRERVNEAIDRALNFLIDHQRPDNAYGSRGADTGITALVVHALAASPRAYREEDGPFVSKAVEYLLAHRQPDGGIYNAGQGLENYKSSIALMALIELDRGRKEPRYSEIVAGLKDFIAGLQCDESSEHPYDRNQHPRAYGGIGYGSDRRPDLSNSHFAIEALRLAGKTEDSEEMRNAIIFLQRCQNLAAVNDTLRAEKGTRSSEDGGAMYAPVDTKAEVLQNSDGSRTYSSYGSMTYALVKSYVYAGLKRDDVRVQKAWEWIEKNYSVEHNPGMVHPQNPTRGYQGLFYYYLLMARTLEVLEVKEIKDGAGQRHFWANELAGRLLALQRPAGEWQNPVDRWWEGDPQVVTAYAVRALSICSRSLVKAE